VVPTDLDEMARIARMAQMRGDLVLAAITGHLSWAPSIGRHHPSPITQNQPFHCNGSGSLVLKCLPGILAKL